MYIYYITYHFADCQGTGYSNIMEKFDKEKSKEEIIEYIKNKYHLNIVNLDGIVPVKK